MVQLGMSRDEYAPASEVIVVDLISYLSVQVFALAVSLTHHSLSRAMRGSEHTDILFLLELSSS